MELDKGKVEGKSGASRGRGERDERKDARESGQVESYRKGLDLEETRSAIKMIKRMGRESVEKSGKYACMGEERMRSGGVLAAYSKLIHHLFTVCCNFSQITSHLSLTVK